MEVLATRMLVVLAGPLDAGSALRTAAAAVKAAARPYGLRFALPRAFQAAVEDIPPGSAGLSMESLAFYPDEGDPLQGVLPLLSGESHFLLLCGEHGFSPRWDAALYAALPARQALLTASISPPRGQVSPVQPSGSAGRRLTSLRSAVASGRARRQTAAPLMAEGDTRVVQRLPVSAAASPKSPPLPAEAYLPALAEDFGEDGVLISRGLPLVCAAGPVRTLVANPALLFGPVSFLQTASPSLDTLSINAYVAGFSLYALAEAPLWPLAQQPCFRLRRTEEKVAPGSTLARFEQLAGFRYEQRRAGIKTTWGLFNVENTYAQHLPHGMAVSQRARAARMRFHESYMPLITTAFIDLPNPRRPVASYILRLGFLKAIESLPLLLYTGGAQERYLRAGFPNVQSYPDNGVLPKGLLAAGMSREQHFKRSKPFLMQRAAKRQVEFTHAAWVDADILPHPICPEAVPDFSPMMDGRIHFALVDGVPDVSFVLAPVKLLPLLVRETLSLTQLDEELKRGLSEEALWRRLFARHPELFTLHPMPRRRLLFLSAFDSRLLGLRLRALLSAAPAPIPGEAIRTSSKRSPGHD
ncbi:MAG: hypothetical protein MR842_03710 [Clostridiales bacterium]|nr:hypothetical protein [Clostridiales bacterium]MDO4350727.1 hypothetical protein [Eubacteriales bacterium]MDY4009014.1 hypothetical protein [Candidatus Limiplasma sp.]